MGLKILAEDNDLDPLLSVVNLVDIFVVFTAALLMIIVQNPMNPFSAKEVVVVTNPNQDNMEVVVKKGKEIKRYTNSNEIGEGEGERAGVAYRLKDGSFIYVPE